MSPRMALHGLSYPDGFLDAVVEAVEHPDNDGWQTARSPAFRRLDPARWNLSRPVMEKALPLLASQGRIDYYMRGRYGPAGTRARFLAEHDAEVTVPNIRRFA